jgi:Coenzyme PQQ synthesis protein D (PqqD)
MSLSPSSRVVVSDQQVFTTVGSEAVILGLHDGVYYGLDAVGARVRSMLATPRMVSEVVTEIVAEVDVSPEVCTRNVLALLEELAARDLVSEIPTQGNAALS